jgi:hypothetical protein
MTSSPPALQKDPSFEGSRDEYRTVKLLYAGHLNQGQTNIFLALNH